MKTYEQKIKFTKTYYIQAKNAEEATDKLESEIEDTEMFGEVESEGFHPFEDETPDEEESTLEDLDEEPATPPVRDPKQEARLYAVYEILVRLAGASVSCMSAFVRAHLDEGCDEWRFCGHLGFGGKYRIHRNEIDCYREEETPERLRIIKEVNEALVKLDAELEAANAETTAS